MAGPAFCRQGGMLPGFTAARSFLPVKKIRQRRQRHLSRSADGKRGTVITGSDPLNGGKTSGPLYTYGNVDAKILANTGLPQHIFARAGAMERKTRHPHSINPGIEEIFERRIRVAG